MRNITRICSGFSAVLLVCVGTAGAAQFLGFGKSDFADPQMFSDSIDASQFSPDYNPNGFIAGGSFHVAKQGAYTVSCDVKASPVWSNTCQAVNARIGNVSDGSYLGPMFSTKCAMPPCHQLICPAHRDLTLHFSTVISAQDNELLGVSVNPYLIPFGSDKAGPAQAMQFTCTLKPFS